jgi:hypothetical protein
VKPDSELIFGYPLIYAVEPEQIQFSPQEVSVLKRYFRQGGTLFVQDFHGDEEFKLFMTQIRKVLPNETVIELPISHQIFHTIYNINTIEQILNDNIAECRDCDKFEGGESGRIPKFFAMYDEFEHMNVIMAWNNDLGEGIENLNDPEYPLHMAASGAKYLVNIIVYMMTH